MNNILEDEIWKLMPMGERGENARKELYQLTEDVVIKYDYWKNNESVFTKRYQFDDDNLDKWYDEFDTSMGRKYYTDKQLFTYFIENIYPTLKPKP